MISWARAVLGQTQELTEPPVTVEEVLGSPQAQVPVFEPPVQARPAPSSWLALGPAVVGLLVAATAAVLFTIQLQRNAEIEHQLLLARQQGDRLVSQNQTLTQQLSASQTERNTLDERVFSLGVQLSAASSELQRANERLAAAEQLAAKLSQTEAVLQEQVEATSKAKKAQQAAEQEAQRLKGDKASLARSVDRLRAQLILLERERRDLATQLTMLQFTPHPGVNVVGATQPTGDSSAVPSAGSSQGQAVELLPVVVRKGQNEPLPVVSGHLVDVNEQHQFVIIDKGTMDGVREGMMFNILRSDTPIGLVTAVRVRPQLTACNIMRTVSPQPLRVGDLAVQRSP